MNIIGFFLPLIIMFAIFYFLIIVPQNKEKARLKDFISNLKEGDEIVTFSGLVGVVKEIREDIVVITTGTAHIIILKEAIRGSK